jgi:hypothetical protein
MRMLTLMRRRVAALEGEKAPAEQRQRTARGWLQHVVAATLEQGCSKLAVGQTIYLVHSHILT